MSLRLKGRKVYFVGKDSDGGEKVTLGKITSAPIYVEVRFEDGNVARMDESVLRFDLKKRGKDR